MKPADNTASTTPVQTGTGAYATTGTLVVEAERSAADGVDWGDFTTVFFAAGVVINLVMITAYIIWAYRQWNKQAANDD